MLTLADDCRAMAERAKSAARLLSSASTTSKNAWLTSCAGVVRRAEAELLAANTMDVAEAPGYGLSAASIDRLTLTPKRIAAMAEGLLQVAALPDPVGEIREGHTRPNGLQVQKVSVPLGVIFFVFESRPNVTVDAAALCVKSGNAVILRGGKEARHTNAALHWLLQQELPKFNMPLDAVQLVTTTDRDAVGHFLKMDDCIDLTIPRGGESLIRRVCSEATMPVLKHFNGNCHIYVDESADVESTVAIIINAKCQRPGVCNAVETILLHQRWAERHWPALAKVLVESGVELRACEASRRLYPQAKPATDVDFATEYLDLILAVKMVSGVQEAMDHIHRFGSKHTDAILTKDLATARRFTQQVDSAAVVVNASTRFNDGFELGLGAEIGISTDKFHARGPCGLKELTIYKYILTGDGHVRH